MSAPPRIALLVHNRFEQDPRVSRHARAALRAGLRVMVLSVVSPEGSGPPRWGEESNGALVYESRVLGTSLLGKLRKAVNKRPRMPAGSPASASPPSGPEPQATLRTSLAQFARDGFTILAMLRNNIGLFRQFRRTGAALVHANDLNVLPAAYLLARAWKVPLLYDSHELWTELAAPWSPGLRRMFSVVERFLIRRSDAVVTVNDAIAGELAARYGIPRPIVVMNCPDTANLPATLTSAPVSARVIYQGVVGEDRGLTDLVDAALDIPDLDLSIRGPGAFRDALSAYIEQSGASQRIRILPPVPMRDLVTALQGFGIGVVPYLPVGKNFQLCSPNKLFEYMAAGLAIVCSDLPVLRSIVTDCGCGLLYTPGDRASLTGALTQLVEDEEFRTRLAGNARRAAVERYNAAHEEGKLLASYGRLLGRQLLGY